MRYNKYSNRKTVVDGISFDSMKEARRYSELKLLERGGEIKDLKLQPKYTLLQSFVDNKGKRHRKVEYVADFYYVDSRNGETVEDVKGMKTAIYKLKKKLFLSQYPQFNFIET